MIMTSKPLKELFTSQQTDIGVQYAKDVQDGTVKANRWIKAITKRFLDDMDSERFYFDRTRAQHFLDFCSYIKQSKDKWVAKPLVLSPFQVFFCIMLFGTFVKDTGLRRYRNVLYFVARKNGKSTLLSAITLYCLLKDPWCSAGAEIYTAATKREQARIVFDEACNMARQSPAIMRNITVYRDKIVRNQPNFGKVIPLASEAKKLDGLNPTLAILDELAAHPNSSVYDILRSAQGSRTNPLCVSITTAGLDADAFGAELLNHCKNVAEGIAEDDSTLPIIYALEEDDDLFDEDNWIKANPGIGQMISYEYLKTQAQEAKGLPSSRINFEIKHMNRFTREANKWLQVDKWLSCKSKYSIFDPDFIAECKAVFLGLDLASVSDMCSLSGVAIMKDGEWRTFSFNYLPEDTVNTAFIKGNTQYQDWSNRGLLTLTPGNITDYAFIKRDITELCDRLPVLELAFDRYNSTSLITDLLGEAVVDCVAFSQSYVGISPALAELERRYLSNQIVHNDNEVLNWALSNAIVIEDPNGNKKLDKAKSKQKIDAAVALVMAVGRASLHYSQGERLLLLTDY